MKSSYSGKLGNCIEVKLMNSSVVLWETDPGLNVQPFDFFYTTRENFQAFIDGVKAGEFDQFGTGS